MGGHSIEMMKLQMGRVITLFNAASGARDRAHSDCPNCSYEDR